MAIEVKEYRTVAVGGGVKEHRTLEDRQLGKIRTMSLDRCDFIALTERNERGRLAGSHLGMAGVRHHDGRRLRMIRNVKACGAIGTDRRRHPCSRRAAPQCIVGSGHAERARIPENVGDRGGQILRGNRGTVARAMLHDEGVESPLLMSTA